MALVVLILSIIGPHSPAQGESISEPERPFIIFARQLSRPPSPVPIEFWQTDFDGANARQIARVSDCEINHMNLHPDGEFLTFACVGYQGPVAILDLSEQRIFEATPGPAGPAFWSPDGAELAYLTFHENGQTLHMGTADGSGDREFGEAPSSTLAGWSPDGRLTFDFARCIPLEQSCVTRSVLVNHLTGEMEDYEEIERLGPWSPGGRYVLGTIRLGYRLNSQRSASDLIDTLTGKRTRIGRAGSIVSPVSWLPDGRSFLVSIWTPGENPYGPQQCETWEVPVSEPTALTMVFEEACSNYLSMDGRYLYYTQIRELGADPQVADLLRVDMLDGAIAPVAENVSFVEYWEPPTGALPRGGGPSSQSGSGAGMPLLPIAAVAVALSVAFSLGAALVRARRGGGL